jgi:hypothetical protein
MKPDFNPTRRNMKRKKHNLNLTPTKPNPRPK